MCTTIIIIIISHVSQQEVEGSGAVTPNEAAKRQLETESHHQEMFPGVSVAKEGDQNQLFISGSWRFKPNHKALLNLTKWRLVPKPNRSISRASCKERSKTIQPKQTESRDLKKCSFAETLSLPIGMSTMNPSVLSSF